MPHFLLKLVPPRPSFAQDMTEDEALVMQQHVAYVQEMAEKGIALIFGPVADPAGVWGLGIVECDNEDSVKAFIKNDPVARSNIGAQYQVFPMIRAMVAKGISKGV